MIVLDASALIDVLIGQPAGEWVLDRITDEEIRSPSHQQTEVLSALARLVRAGNLHVDEAHAALRHATNLPQRLVIPSATHLRRAFELRERVRVLDGLYVAVAEDNECPLITTDIRLVRSAPPCEVECPPA